MLYRIHPALGDGKFSMTVKCGNTVLVNSASTRAGSSGVLSFSFAGVAPSVSTMCTVELQQTSLMRTGPGAAESNTWTEEIELIRVPTSSPVQTVVDYETHSIQVRL